MTETPSEQQARMDSVDDPHPGGTERNCTRLHHTTQNGVQFNTYELFISGTFNLIFSDISWPQVTETT